MSLRYRDLPQIPAEQLRFGNIVTTGPTQVTVKSVSENYCRVVFHHPKNGDYVEVRKLSELRPVIVNDTRIERLGFLKIANNVFHKGETDYLLKYDGEDLFELFTLNSYVKIAEGNFLHHLQNLINDLLIKEFKL